MRSNQGPVDPAANAPFLQEEHRVLLQSTLQAQQEPDALRKKELERQKRLAEVLRNLDKLKNPINNRWGQKCSSDQMKKLWLEFCDLKGELERS